MADPPRPGYSSIELSSGDYLDLLNPEPELITLEVVAHHLHQCNRYAGAPRRPYSVLEHSLLVVAYMVEVGSPPEEVLAGLHHDDAEAFVHDITRPLKEQLPTYKPIEARLMEAIAVAFDFAALDVDCDSPAVRAADHWALSCEAYHLMPSQGKGWWCEGLYDPTQANTLWAARWHWWDPAAVSPARWIGVHKYLAEGIK